MKKFNKKGFTIVELVIVIAVIGILAGVLIPTFSSITQRANETAAMQEATAGRDAILVLTEGQMPEKSMFYINEYDKTATSYTTNYVFAYENGAMNAKNIEKEDDLKAPEYKTNTYVAYVSTEVLNIANGVADGFNNEHANYPLYLAKLAGFTGEALPADSVKTTSDFITITWKIITTEAVDDDLLTEDVNEAVEEVSTTYTIQVYWSSDLHDTLVIFLAGASAQA